MKFAVVVFPGSNSDYDAFYAASQVVGEDAELVGVPTTIGNRTQAGQPPKG